MLSVLFWLDSNIVWSEQATGDGPLMTSFPFHHFLLTVLKGVHM
jgi:hypothetical protein